MADKKDFYESLGISKNSTKDEIKSAYRKLAKKYHPDNKETGNEATFKEITEAYEILSNDEKRAAYDRFGHAAFDQAGGNPGAGNPFSGFSGFGSDGVDLGDIFSSFFGGGSSNRRRNFGPQRGNDVVMRLKIDFMDTINGKDLSIPYQYDDICPSCNGSGAKTSKDIHTCSNCHGTGYVNTTKRSIFGMVETQDVCPVCGGKGKVIDNKCPDCNGAGYVKKKVDLKLHVPAGINSGQQIRVSGKGERGLNGGPNGDLYVEMIVKPHPYFIRKGNDITVKIDLDFFDAILGLDIPIQTVYGEKTLSIPSGINHGTLVRMKGYGVKDLRGGKPGDQFVEINIKMPNKLSKEQKELLSKYRDTVPLKNRAYQDYDKK